MGSREGKLNVLMLPWLAHGHISPFLELAKKLTHRNFHIYFCSTLINLTPIKKTLPEKYQESIQLVELHLPDSPDLPSLYHTTNGLPFHLMQALKAAFYQSSPAFTTLLKNIRPDLLIYDFNQPWAPLAASSLGIPAVLFLTFGAAFTSFTLHGLETPHGDYPFDQIRLYESEIENFKIMIDASADGVRDEDLFFGSVENSCDLVLIQGSREIEGKYMDYLSQWAKKKIQGVGLLVQEPTKELKDGDLEIIKWLEKKEEASVVFVSFGSEYFLTHEERGEIAHGLEMSGVSFVWVVRFPKGEEKISSESAFPEGFMERVGEKGRVNEGWALQARILAHQSTGGFVSHCGWGSVLESLKFGVAIIAAPMHLDQPLNARLVEEVGIGVEVKRDHLSGRLDREEIARVVGRVVVEKSGAEVRKRVRELSEKIAMKNEEEIDQVVEELVQLSGDWK